MRTGEFVLDNVNALLDLEQPLTSDDMMAERVGVRPLATEGTGGVADWVKLSRKHVIEAERAPPASHYFRRQAYRLPERGR